jgi:hypothetical protein
MKDERPSQWMVVGVHAWTLANVVLYGSVFAAFVFESRPAAFIAIVAFAAVLAMHVLLAVVEYRRTMRRPWPNVPPLLDDDDD